MGTGTSHGVPVIGCNCSVCNSKDPHDTRYRCSAYLKEPASIVIDTGPEFRLQALKFGIKRIDAVLITHSHADHLNGLDDIRVFSHTEAVDPYPTMNAYATEGKGKPVFANSNTITDIKNRFDYIFTPVKEGGGKPKLDLIDCASYGADNPIRIKGVEIIPIPLLHGSLKDSGWLLTEIKSDGSRHSIAYLTDCSCVPEASVRLLKENCGIMEHVVIDGLRIKPHSTHFSFDQAISVAERLSPNQVWLTHLTHDMSHEAVRSYVKDLVRNSLSVEPAYDGLELEA